MPTVAQARPLPRDGRLDATSALLADPYRYLGRRARELGSDAFATRLGLQRTICLTGPDAARLFYDPELFAREGGAPEPLRATLLGKGGIQNLDGAAHAHRKRWFLSLLGPGSGSVEQLATLFRDEWTVAARHWSRLSRVALFPAIQPVLTRAVCRWAGVPVAKGELARRTRELVALFDEAAAVGAGHLRSRLARGAAEQWIGGLVGAIRTGDLAVPVGSALASVAALTDERGRLLDARVAAVELLNVLRPTVAVSVYVTFVAHALHLHPGVRALVAAGDPDPLDAFVDEVRRYYPFFPAVAARVRRDFEWRGLRFEAGTRTLLDLHGTNHDPRAWAAPELFRPERFRDRTASAFDLVPQGGGVHATGHRCPGEWITRELMKVAARQLTLGLRYRVPRQDLALEWSRLPALPKSRMVLRDVALRSPGPTGSGVRGPVLQPTA